MVLNENWWILKSSFEAEVAVFIPWMETDEVSNSFQSVWFSSLRLKSMNSKINEAVNTQNFHHMDENRWIFIYLPRLWNLFTSLGCKPKTFVLKINLNGICLDAHEGLPVNESWVSNAPQSRQTGWKHPKMKIPHSAANVFRLIYGSVLL